MIFSVSAVERPFFGWRIVGAAFTVLFVVYGIQFSFGTFVGDVVADTGWSETRLQLIFAIYIGLYSALSALSGWLTDRWGPRPIVATGSILLTGGYLLWATSDSLIIVALGMGIVAPLGMSCSWVPCNATVVRWFVVRRGLATAIATSGGSLANILVPPIAALLVDAYGWRVAIVGMSIFGGVCMLLSALALERDPESIGQVPDGSPMSSRHTTEDGLTGVSPAEAWRSITYWQIFGMYALTFVAVFIPFVHLVQFAQSLGASLQTASTVISAIGIGGLVGRLVMGPISDRIGRKTSVILALGIETAAFMGMAISSGLWLLYPSAAAFGFAYGGGVVVFPPLVADLFGRAHAGAIVGRIFATAGSMAAIGPYVAQLIHNALGDYRWAFLLSGVANGCALLLATRLPRVTNNH
ncbi:MAG: MFS transporter [Actinomycetota bacterium]|nr:MFS transporter [Acidimicrobiales bacterium]MEC7873398.1 MFS transporter [Actinomycetota bacterium]MEC8923036.1 MFS transporter [Actinomycetota bacterium]MEC9269222.1 MFS transporter [Actinomycetota bacterium]MEC9315810.1 MFS transporter [Actinomycetota bacterium]